MKWVTKDHWFMTDLRNNNAVKHKVFLVSIWWLALIGWTIGLLRPEPIRLGNQWIPPFYGWFLAKGTHFGMYALLAFGAMILTTGNHKKGFFLLILAGHAMLTEYFQQFVALRHGSIQDVLVDWAGIFSGWGCFFILASQRLARASKKLHPQKHQETGKE